MVQALECVVCPQPSHGPSWLTYSAMTVERNKICISQPVFSKATISQNVVLVPSSLSNQLTYLCTCNCWNNVSWTRNSGPKRVWEVLSFSPSPQEAGPPEGCWNGDLAPNRGRYHYHLHFETLSLKNAILFAVKTGNWTLHIGFLTTKLYLVRYNQFFFASYLFHLHILHNLWSKVYYSENNDIESFAWNIWQNLHQMRLIVFFQSKHFQLLISF